MNDEEKARQAAQVHMHSTAAHCMCDGLEIVIDARIAAAIYAARLARILATLRVRGLSDANEIEQIAEHIVAQSMSDENIVGVHDNHGHEIIAPGTKLH